MGDAEGGKKGNPNFTTQRESWLILDVFALAFAHFSQKGAHTVYIVL